MRQEHGAPLVRQLDRRVGVRLIASGGTAEEVGRHPVGVGSLRLLELDVDLPGQRLVAVLDGRGALAHLDALHPRSGDVAQGIGRGGSAEVGDVLGEQLDVGAREAQQTDLLGSRGGVGVVDVDRRVGDEALAEVAAGGAEQLFARHHVGVHHTATQLAEGYLAGSDVDLGQLHAFAQDDVDVLLFGSDGQRVGGEADAAHHEPVGSARTFQGKGALEVGARARLRAEPHDVGAGNGLAVGVRHAPGEHAVGPCPGAHRPGQCKEGKYKVFHTYLVQLTRDN